MMKKNEFGMVPISWLLAYRDNELTFTQFIVLVALSIFWRDKEYCWPTHKQISNLIKVRRDHVREHLLALEKKGFISIYDESNCPIQMPHNATHLYKLMVH